VSGVGFSFGVDRIYDVMEELGLFPAQSATSTRVLLVAFDAEAQRYALPVLRQLREAGVNSELYPDPAKLKKQLDYANAKGIPYVVLIGSNEMATGPTGPQRHVGRHAAVAGAGRILIKLCVRRGCSRNISPFQY
jgi:histidyl-tRNA synthetase